MACGLLGGCSSPGGLCKSLHSSGHDERDLACLTTFNGGRAPVTDGRRLGGGELADLFTLPWR